MSKEKDNIIQALDNMSTAFDEYGFEPTIPTTEDYEHFNEWFLFEIEIIKSNATKQEQQIDQLKQQLAEKDEEIDSLIADYEKRISQEQELMSNMEHQLTEKQNTIDEINKEFVQSVKDWKTLCAEKNKEIEKWHKLYKDRDNQFQSVRQRYHLLNRLQASYDKKDKLHLSEMQCLELIEINEKLQKNQTQLAIQELEKAKDLIKHFCDIHSDEYYGVKSQVKGIEQDVCEEIDNQIKGLKGE